MKQFSKNITNLENLTHETGIAFICKMSDSDNFAINKENAKLKL